jgi:hypothetical protein
MAGRSGKPLPLSEVQNILSGQKVRLSIPIFLSFLSNHCFLSVQMQLDLPLIEIGFLFTHLPNRTSSTASIQLFLCLIRSTVINSLSNAIRKQNQVFPTTEPTFGVYRGRTTSTY